MSQHNHSVVLVWIGPGAHSYIAMTPRQVRLYRYLLGQGDRLVPFPEIEAALGWSRNLLRVTKIELGRLLEGVGRIACYRNAAGRESAYRLTLEEV